MNKIDAYATKKSFSVIFSIILIAFYILPSSFEGISAEVQTKSEVLVCEGTEYQTVAYFLSSEKEGPSIMILSGVHGDEPAGIEASKKKIEQFMPERGTVIFIPEANKQACEKKVRPHDWSDDLNRHYPGNSELQDINQLAGEIFKILEENDIDFLLDLHESIDYYAKNPLHYGQTIILDDDNHPFLRNVSSYLVQQLNRMVLLPENQFEAIVKPIKGSSTYEALYRQGIPGITFETCRKMNFEKRVSFHETCIQNILAYFNMTASSTGK